LLVEHALDLVRLDAPQLEPLTGQAFEVPVAAAAGLQEVRLMKQMGLFSLGLLVTTCGCMGQKYSVSESATCSVPDRGRVHFS
jgi:hypothetical protein